MLDVGCSIASRRADPRQKRRSSVTASASGLYGFIKMTIGAVCAAVVTLGSDPALSAGVVLLSACVLGQACFHVASRTARREIAHAVTG